MNLRQLFSTSSVFASIALLQLGASPLAAHGVHVTELNFDNSKGENTLAVQWSEAGQVEVQKFPSAKQVIIKISDAHLASDAPSFLDATESSLYSDVKVQELMESNGNSAVQIRLKMKEWSAIDLEQSPNTLFVKQLTSRVPDFQDTTVSVSQQKPNVVTFSNDDIESWKSQSFGSSSAPSSGAGQGSNSASTLPFYVPPDLTNEERSENLIPSDLGVAATEEILNSTVNLDFKDADLENVIRSIASKSGMNIIIMPGDVQGTVTVSLKNIKLGQAMESMLRANDLAYTIETGGIVRIVPRSEVEINDKEIVTQSIAVNWIDASEVQRIITSFLTEDGSVQAHTQSNTIIIEDVPEKVSQIQQLIQRIDVPEKQVRMEVRLVDMTENAFRGLGIQHNYISQGGTETIPLDGGSVDPNSATPLFTPDLVSTAGGFVDPSGGLDLNIFDSISIFGQDASLDTRLTAIERRGEAVTLASPTIVSLNNITALIEIKRQIPYRDATNTTQGSVSTIRFADVGTRVEITPRITNNGYVVMNIIPEQKIQVSTDDVTGVPIIDERFAETSVITKDEQTIVLGGLRQFEGNNSESGIPWILRAPVLGWLFKTSTFNQNKVELVLFVTPHIIKDPEPTAYERAVYDKIDYNWDLPDYYFDNVNFRSSEAELNDPNVKSIYLD